MSGEWLRCDNPDVVSAHDSKVYGLAEVGAPPMSVPHLDARVVDGEVSLLFGPYAGFTPKFLKYGSWFDLFSSLRWHNIIPMLAVAFQNLGLLRYLIREVFASRGQRLEALYKFYPGANPHDWSAQVAGQRVQIIKPDSKKLGVLQFGTEIVSHSDGSIAGLLGASPGASTSVAIMLDLLRRCFPTKIQAWEASLKEMVPSYSAEGIGSGSETVSTLRATARSLKL